MSTSFKSLGLSSESLDAVRRARFASPTPIQAQAIPPALAGRDVIGCAVTGTGKTAAYLLPLVERLAGERGPVGLVLAPTRELVLQIAQEAAFFGEPRGLTQAVVTGGTDMGAQVEALRQRPTLVLATPGRLADLLKEGVANLSAVRMLVLDEADRTLEMGFMPELQQILAALPRERQTLLFSATLGHNVTRFAQEVLRKPVRVEVTPSGTPAARAVQRLYEVEASEKYPLLLSLLAKDQLSVLVFTRTRERAEKVQEVLKRAGHKTAAIHADRTQGQRRQALEGFRRGQYRCLVATDIASRGLDVEDIGHVINFDLPHAPEDYVHRIGRTARAGASGRASTFVTSRDEETVRAIERIVRMSLPRAEVPREDPVFVEELEEFQAGQEDAELTKPRGLPRPTGVSAKGGRRGGGRARAVDAFPSDEVLPGWEEPGDKGPTRRGNSGREADRTHSRPTSGGRGKARGASHPGEGQERRGKGARRKGAPGRGGSSARGTAPRRENEEAPRRERPVSPRRGEGGREREPARGEKRFGGQRTGKGKGFARGPKRPGGKGAGPRGKPPRGTGRSPRGQGGGGRRGR
ncbi:DEAD/DEAH box helicase [Stigmatella aurantiaca]|uniref:ATP-dependent RNA helicase n=1 Tax=Stigmatella aurantiaca (strain DW4/3-1) TaxID=378806 RepID=E3FZ64_STIAD|nr:ATP-dependent RNA helicase [Stigmatella aurantiaca DW4/3-1]